MLTDGLGVHATAQEEPRRRLAAEAHLAASSTAFVVGAALSILFRPSFYAVIGALVAFQSLCWFAAARWGLLRKGPASRASARLLAAPSALGGTVAFDVGWVD